MIRIGASCVLSMNMIRPECKVIETRKFFDESLSNWYEISAKCISEKKFLILTQCIDKNGKLDFYPTESYWRQVIEDDVKSLIALGGNKNNCRLDIINEPMKFISKEQYANLINIAYDQVNGKKFRLPVGAGCDELIYTEMYQYISSHAKFDTLVIHIQGACSSELATINYTNFALNLATSYKRQIDCNEANYFSIDTDSGYKGLLMNLKYAEKIGCANFPMVFINLDKSAFEVNTDRWERLAFFVNGKQHSPYWNDFKNIMEAKCPVPNIVPLPIQIEEEDMKLKVLKVGSRGNQVLWLQEILAYSYGIDNEGGFDGIYGSKTFKQVKTYQRNNELTLDGLVGKQTMAKLIENSLNPEVWFMRLKIYMAFE